MQLARTQVSYLPRWDQKWDTACVCGGETQSLGNEAGQIQEVDHQGIGSRNWIQEVVLLVVKKLVRSSKNIKMTASPQSIRQSIN